MVLPLLGSFLGSAILPGMFGSLSPLAAGAIGSGLGSLLQGDDLDEAILNTRMEVKVQQRLTPSLGLTRSYNIYFPVPISAPDDKTYIISSTKFTVNNISCVLRNRLSSTTMEVVDTSGNVVVDNIGSYTAAAGRIDLTGLNVTAFEGTAIKISALPTNQSTIRPLRASLLNLDQEISKANAILDYQNTQVSLSGDTQTSSSGSTTSSGSSSGY